jgi:hypothetical protein
LCSAMPLSMISLAGVRVDMPSYISLSISLQVKYTAQQRWLCYAFAKPFNADSVLIIHLLIHQPPWQVYTTPPVVMLS